LISVQGFSLSAFPAGVFALPSNQQLEATTYMKSTFTITIKKSEPLITINGSDLTLSKILLWQPLCINITYI
ncbi:hypothetical protein P4374_35315, partial [Bacillus thuringiensis]|nr:hypothetical protein [Bacillus thuringiensis]